MISLAIIGAILYVISGILCGISIFGYLYHKITSKTSKTLSNIAFTLACISGIFSWSFIFLN